MAVISGQRTTGNVASIQRAIDLAKPILLLEPEAAPLTVLTKSIQNGGNVRATEDPKFRWVEDEAEDRWDEAAAEVAKEATEAEVENGEVFYAGALVKVPSTGEIFRVTKVEEDTLTIVKGYAGTEDAKIAAEAALFVIGSSAEEGDTSFAARSANPSEVFNYTQIFRTSIEESGTALASGNLTSPHDWRHQHRKKMIEHLKDIEHAGLFGGKGEATGPEGRPLRTTGGALSFLTANGKDAEGELKEGELEEWVRTLTRYGSKKKTVFCSRLILSVINEYAVGKLQTIQADQDKTYGLAITQYMTANGTLSLVSHPLLEESYSGYAIAVDMKNSATGYRYLGGKGNAVEGSRDTKVLPNRQANDADAQRDEIFSECGFEFRQVKTGGILTGVTS